MPEQSSQNHAQNNWYKKIYDHNLTLRKKTLKFWTAMNRICWKLRNPNSANQNMLSHKKTNETEKLLQKEPILFFAPISLWIFLLSNCMNWKNPRGPFLIIMVMRFAFFGRTLSYPEEFRTENIEDGYYKIRFNGTESSKELFHVGILRKS